MAKAAKGVPQDLIDKFKSIGLSDSKATEAAKNAKLAPELAALIDANGLCERSLDAKQGALVAALAAAGGDLGTGEKAYVVSAIEARRLASNDQVSAAVEYLRAHPLPVDDADFDAECGVGVNVTEQEIDSGIAVYMAQSAEELASAGWAAFTSVVSKLRATKELRWASPLLVKEAAERAFVNTFGPRGPTGSKGKSKKPAGKEDATAATPEAPSGNIFEEGFLGKLHKPGGNPQIHPHLREAHLQHTGGKVVTRFPPEPNGYLHIGHSKAIFINFGYAKHYGGVTYLRYDDTNPEGEEVEYFESILEIVKWLGFEPYKVTYTSDYFDRLYDLAMDLIRRGKAYTCHCTGAEITADRGLNGGQRKECRHRNRPIEESLDELERMRRGEFPPETVTLRMKQDILGNPNPQMWDLIAYRVIPKPHVRTGNKWCIYPSYDFAHCLVDSFENISHSLCTTEFINSRESYEWLCDALEVYKPRQSESGRLSIEGTVMSKRLIRTLVKEGYVSGWNDPRLFTMIALRRRGVPPGAILEFVRSLGVSTAITHTQTHRLDNTIRHYLENAVPRLMVVLRPLKVTLENTSAEHVEMTQRPLHPKKPEFGSVTVPFSHTLYIDADDFRLEDAKDYFRLAPGKTVGLLNAPYPITCTSYKTDPETGKVAELFCRLENGAAVAKPKAYIHWVAEHAPSGSPVPIEEVRIFERLFKSDDPAALDDFRTDLNPLSLEVVHGALVDVGFWTWAKMACELEEKEVNARKATETAQGVPVAGVGNSCVRFQAMRVAYFALDSDAHLGFMREAGRSASGLKPGDKIILNRIVSLKEDASKVVGR